MNILLKDKGIYVMVEKHVEKFKYCLLGLCALLYISIFAASSEMPLGEMSIEKKNIRSAEYFDHIPVANGIPQSNSVEKKEDIVLVPIGEN